MCVKLPPKDLNTYPYSPHSTNTYTRGVIIVSRYVVVKKKKEKKKRKKVVTSLLS